MMEALTDEVYEAALAIINEVRVQTIKLGFHTFTVVHVHYEVEVDQNTQVSTL